MDWSGAPRRWNWARWHLHDPPPSKRNHDHEWGTLPRRLATLEAFHAVCHGASGPGMGPPVYLEGPRGQRRLDRVDLKRDRNLFAPEPQFKGIPDKEQEPDSRQCLNTNNYDIHLRSLPIPESQDAWPV